MALLTFSFCGHRSVNLEDEHGEGSTHLTLHGVFHFRPHMFFFLLTLKFVP